MNDDKMKKTGEGAPAASLDHLTIAEVRELYANDQLRTGDILDAIGFDRDRILVSGWGRTDLPPPGTKTDFFAIGVRPEDEAEVEAMFERLRAQRRRAEDEAQERQPEE